MTHISALPKEILMQIFNFYLETESQENFHHCVANVCQEWENLCRASSFWHKFDGSLSEKVLLQFCAESRLIRTEELTFSYIKKMTSIEKVFSALPNLRSIDLSNIRNLSSNVFDCLAAKCHRLCEVKFSSDINFSNYIVSSALLSNFFSLQGRHLTVIDLSHTVISNMQKLILLVAFSCPNLLQLRIQNVKYATKAIFPLNAVQRGCPKMKVLCLDMKIYFSKHKTESLPGFPNLELFSYLSIEYESFTDKQLIDILSKSTNLKTLDVRGCKSLTVNGFLSLPANHLEKLYLAKTNLFLNDRINDIFAKWGRSLRTLDVSRLKSNRIDCILKDATSMGRMTHLEYLDLSSTNVSVATVVEIIENCENLRFLNLSSCRTIGRGRMREYWGRNSLEELLQNLIYQDL